MSDLSFGWRYQPFEKLGPDLWGKRTESFFSLQRIMQALEPQFIHGIVRLLKRKNISSCFHSSSHRVQLSPNSRRGT